MAASGSLPEDSACSAGLPTGGELQARPVDCTAIKERHFRPKYPFISQTCPKIPAKVRKFRDRPANSSRGARPSGARTRRAAGTAVRFPSGKLLSGSAPAAEFVPKKCLRRLCETKVQLPRPSGCRRTRFLHEIARRAARGLCNLNRGLFAQKTRESASKVKLKDNIWRLASVGPRVRSKGPAVFRIDARSAKRRALQRCIVLRPLRRIRQSFVSLARISKPLSSFFPVVRVPAKSEIARIQQLQQQQEQQQHSAAQRCTPGGCALPVWMPPERRLPVCFLEFVLSGISFHAENGVEVGN